LIWTLVPGVVALVVAAGAGLYAYVDETMEHSVNAALIAKAEAITALVRMEDDGKPHFRMPDRYAAEFANPGGAAFQIWRANGEVLARSESLHGQDIPQPASFARGHRFGDVSMPDGSPGRATRMTITPIPDLDVDEHGKQESVHSDEQMVLVVAQGQHGMIQTLGVLLSGLLVAAGLMTAGIVAIVTWSVRRGLRPLDQIAADADRVGPDALDVRFPTESIPEELAPISRKLNELLDRLRAAFQRERRFSADVAHELRTPIAELRSLCEVALRWPSNDGHAATESFGEALSIAKQMEATVTTLLALVRSHSGVQPTRLEAVDLSTILAPLVSTAQRAAAERGLNLETQFTDHLTLLTDRTMLSVVLRNLLANAVEYAPEGGSVRVETIGTPDGVEFRVGNTNASLEQADLKYLFEPFWRKDAARTGGVHAGLGLALVSSYCAALKIGIETSLRASDWFEVHLRAPRESIVATTPQEEEVPA
jgi:signal transduction histidine kinase